MAWVATLLLTACELPTVPSAEPELPATASVPPAPPPKLPKLNLVLLRSMERNFDNLKRTFDSVMRDFNNNSSNAAQQNFDNAARDFDNVARDFDNTMRQLQETGAFVETRAESVAPDRSGPDEPAPATHSALAAFACRIESGASREDLLRFIDCTRIGGDRPECDASWLATRHVGAHGIARIRIDVHYHCAE